MNQSKNDAFALLMSAWLLRMRFFESAFLWGSGGTGCCSRDWIGSHRIVSGQYGDISRQLLRQIKCVGRYQDILPAFGCTYSQHSAWPSVFTAWLSDKWLADIMGESIRCESSRLFGTFVEYFHIISDSRRSAIRSLWCCWFPCSSWPFWQSFILYG